MSVVLGSEGGPKTLSWEDWETCSPSEWLNIGCWKVPLQLQDLSNCMLLKYSLTFSEFWFVLDLWISLLIPTRKGCFYPPLIWSFFAIHKYSMLTKMKSYLIKSPLWHPWIFLQEKSLSTYLICNGFWNYHLKTHKDTAWSSIRSTEELLIQC